MLFLFAIAMSAFSSMVKRSGMSECTHNIILAVYIDGGNSRAKIMNAALNSIAFHFDLLMSTQANYREYKSCTILMYVQYSLLVSICCWNSCFDCNAICTLWLTCCAVVAAVPSVDGDVKLLRQTKLFPLSNRWIDRYPTTSHNHQHNKPLVKWTHEGIN